MPCCRYMHLRSFNGLEILSAHATGTFRCPLFFRSSFHSPPLTPRPPVSPSRLAVQMLPDPLDVAKNAARQTLYYALRHCQFTEPGAERDQETIEDLHVAILEAMDEAIRDELYSFNPRIWRVPNAPNEVWSEIWTLLPMHDRVAVSHVCRDWRRIALSSPSLWSDIDFEYSCNAHYEDYPKQCRLDGSPDLEHGSHINTWTHIGSLRKILKRGNAPISFSLRISGEHWNCTEEVLRTLARTLKPHVHRLVDLKIVADEQRLDLALFLIQIGPVFPRLVSLIAKEDWNDAIGNVASKEAIAMDARMNEFEAPMLRTAEIDIRLPYLQLLISKAQVPDLRRAMFHPRSYKEGIDILHACPRLTSLR